MCRAEKSQKLLSHSSNHHRRIHLYLLRIGQKCHAESKRCHAREIPSLPLLNGVAGCPTERWNKTSKIHLTNGATTVLRKMAYAGCELLWR